MKVKQCDGRNASMAFARFVPLCRVRLLFAAFRGGGDNRAEKKRNGTNFHWQQTSQEWRILIPNPHEYCMTQSSYVVVHQIPIANSRSGTVFSSVADELLHRLAAVCYVLSTVVGIKRKSLRKLTPKQSALVRSVHWEPD